MAATTILCDPATPAAMQSAAEQDDHQSRREYAPSIWGDFFVTHQPCTPEELQCMKEKAQAKKEEVRQIVLDAAASDDLTRKLDLIDVLERIGLDHHYNKEIDEMLLAIYDDKHGAGHQDLYVTSLRFYLLRKHGYAVSSGKKLISSSFFSLTIYLFHFKLLPNMNAILSFIILISSLA